MLRSKRRQIAIPASSSSNPQPQQSPKTPSWSNLPKMSRLDELLSRNETIYQNMRNQLQEISRSNQNIDANINIIKPMYQDEEASQQNEGSKFGTEGSLQEQGTNLEVKSECAEEGYTFMQLPRSNTEIKNLDHGHNLKQSKGKSNSVYMNAPISAKQQRVFYKQSEQSSIEASRPVTSSQHTRKQTYQMPNLNEHKISSYCEADSSRIGEEMHIVSLESKAKTIVQVHQEKLYQASVGPYEPAAIDKRTSQNFHTFEEAEEDGDDKSQENVSFHEIKMKSTPDHSLKSYIRSQQSQAPIHDQSRPRSQHSQARIRDPSLPRSNHSQFPTREPDLQISVPSSELVPAIERTPPPQLSLTYIPFNKLYSSPILQLTSKKQLLLARKSKTQLHPSANTNRIIYGIKYKCNNLVHDEIQLYEALVKHIRTAEAASSAGQERRGTGEFDSYGQERVREGFWGRRSTDVGIIGGQNCMKKKLHFGLLAHVYADVIQKIEELGPVKEGALTLGIEHQEQQGAHEPYVIQYQSQLKNKKGENQIIYGNIRAAIEQIFNCMKSKLSDDPHYQHRIRVTRVYLLYSPPINQNNRQQPVDMAPPQTLYNVKIISTNKIDMEFVNSLELHGLVWCLNPLFKYYQQTKDTLDCLEQARLERLRGR